MNGGANKGSSRLGPLLALTINAIIYPASKHLSGDLINRFPAILSCNGMMTGLPPSLAIEQATGRLPHQVRASMKR
jgi:hypothetical protein